MVDLERILTKFSSLLDTDCLHCDSSRAIHSLCRDGSMLLRFLFVLFPNDFWSIYRISDARFQGAFLFARKCVDCGMDRATVPCPLSIADGATAEGLILAISFLMSKAEQYEPELHTGPVSEESGDTCTCLRCRWSRVIRVLCTEDHVLGRFSPSVRRLVEEGIPSAAREHAWLIMSGALQNVRSRHPSYQSLFPRAFEESAHVDLIDLDISRTFQDCVEWRQKGFDRVTRRILLAYSIRNPSLGYCQGLSYIAGLLAMVASEEVAFCIFLTIIEDGLVPPDYYTSLRGALVDQQVLETLLVRFVDGFDLFDEISCLSIPWSMCLFSTSFSMDVCIRLWDFLFAFGPCVLFRVGLGLLHALMNSGTKSREKLKQIELSTSSADISVYVSQFSGVTNELIAEIRDEIRSHSSPGGSYDCFLLSVNSGESGLSVSDDNFYGSSPSSSSLAVSDTKRRKEARRRAVQGLSQFMFS